MSQIELNSRDVKVHVPEPLSLVYDLLLKNDNINDIINNKLKLNLDTKTNGIILNVFTVLLGKTVDSSPLKSIINGIKECFADGKIDVNDVPTLVKIITDVLNLNKSAFKDYRPTFEHIGIVIKIIISVLADLDIIKRQKGEDVLILKIVDSSLALLNTTVQLENVNWKGLFCCCK